MAELPTRLIDWFHVLRINEKVQEMKDQRIEQEPVMHEEKFTDEKIKAMCMFDFMIVSPHALWGLSRDDLHIFIRFLLIGTNFPLCRNIYPFTKIRENLHHPRKKKNYIHIMTLSNKYNLQISSFFF